MKKYKALLADQDWTEDFIAEVSLKEGSAKTYEMDRNGAIPVPGWFHRSGLAKKIYARPYHGMTEDFASQCVWLLSDEEYELIKEIITEYSEHKINFLCNKAEVEIVGR